MRFHSAGPLKGREINVSVTAMSYQIERSGQLADSRRAANGKFLERLGFYDPKAPQGRESLRVNLERVKHWKGKGAQLSPTVSRLVKQFAKKVS